jgi:hypothetical protein
LILALDGLSQLVSSFAELRIGVGHGEDVAPGSGAAQVDRRRVEMPPELIGTPASRARLQLIRRLTGRSAVRRPLQAGSLGSPTRIGLGECGL